MSIIASVPVPAGSRLVDLPTDPNLVPVQRPAIPGTLCPVWCTVNHDEDRAERLHSRELAEVTAPHGDDLREERYISVEVEAYESPELPGGIDPTSIYLAVGSDRELDTSARLSPEVAEQLAAALFEAARIARQARR